MKILQVCDRTGLSERTVRFYESERLIRPSTETRNERTYRDYSEADVEDLRTIAGLRRAAFSLPEIRDMMREPARIPAILEGFRSRAQAELDDRGNVLRALERLDPAQCRDAATLSASLRKETGRLELPQADVHPNFGRFDGISPEEREQEYRAYLEREEEPERIARDLKSSGAALLESLRFDIRRPGCGIAAGLVALIPAALLGVRMAGFFLPDADPEGSFGTLLLTFATFAIWASFAVEALFVRRRKGLGAISALVGLLLLWVVELVSDLPAARDLLGDNAPFAFYVPAFLVALLLVLILADFFRRPSAAFATRLTAFLALAYCLVLQVGTMAGLLLTDRAGDLLPTLRGLVADPYAQPTFYGILLFLPVLLLEWAIAGKKPVPASVDDVQGQDLYLANKENRTIDLTHPR